jgi:hypothetical protein
VEFKFYLKGRNKNGDVQVRRRLLQQKWRCTGAKEIIATKMEVYRCEGDY